MEDFSFEEFFDMYLFLFFVCVAKPNRNYVRRKRTETKGREVQPSLKLLNLTHKVELMDEKSAT